MIQLNITQFEFENGNVKRIRCLCDQCGGNLWIDPADHINEAVLPSVNAVVRCRDCSEKMLSVSDGAYHA